MKLNVAQLMKAAVGSTREYDLEEVFPEVEGEPLRRPVHMHIHLTRINEGLLARGDVDTVLEAACSRCVEPAEQPISFHFEEEFIPSIDILTGAPVKPPDPDEPVYTIDPNHVMDLDEVIRQGVVIETPMHPLCRPDCQGLCPDCGKNLNEDRCTCATDEPLSPLAAALKDLKPILVRDE